ncbi:MAG: ABC transporter ATP-binding protein [Candidatus Riflebacteria bacterium]|nr:ABC transporter ATP-binding protein [Candidatus Riflebacteria bacterium]
MIKSDSSAIKVGNLHKSFGKKRALSGMSFEVPLKTVAGFLGPNGAGKTTALRLLLGLVSADDGEMELLGMKMPSSRAMIIDRLGALVESPSFIETMSGFDNLWWFGSLFRTVENKRLNEAIELVGLTDAAFRPFGTYSSGMKQRLGVAFAILHNPEILILDEPTNGMDPQGRAQMREIFKNIHQTHQTTIFLSSHLLDEVQRLCDFVVIVDSGKMIKQGFVKDLLSSEKEELEIRIPIDLNSKAIELLRKIPEVNSVEAIPRGLAVSIKPGQAQLINKNLVVADIPVSAIIPKEASLEETFLKLTDSGEN